MKSFFQRGLSKTKELFSQNLGSVLPKYLTANQYKETQGKVLEKLENALYRSDVSVATSTRLIQRVKMSIEAEEMQSKLGRPQKDSDEEMEKEVFVDVKGHLRKEMIQLFHANMRLNKGAKDSSKRVVIPSLGSKYKPTILFVVGINGVGKTTTVAKLTHLYGKVMKKNILVAAADVTRAAAVQQLERWVKNTGARIFTTYHDPKTLERIDHKEKDMYFNNDESVASRVVYDAINYCRIEKSNTPDLLIVDTAGRLQNNQSSMRDLKKIYDLANKTRKNAPDHVWLVLDGTIGQSSIEQAKIFKQTVNVNGVIVTKLDGSAKGGVLLSIANELQLPILFVGLGEKIDDLKPFSPSDYVDSILGFENTQKDDGIDIQI